MLIYRWSIEERRNSDMRRLVCFLLRLCAATRDEGFWPSNFFNFFHSRRAGTSEMPEATFLFLHVLEQDHLCHIARLHSVTTHSLWTSRSGHFPQRWISHWYSWQVFFRKLFWVLRNCETEIYVLVTQRELWCFIDSNLLNVMIFSLFSEAR